jgi:hypothetical protein
VLKALGDDVTELADLTPATAADVIASAKATAKPGKLVEKVRELATEVRARRPRLTHYRAASERARLA